MIVECFNFISNNKSYFIIELLIVAVNIFGMVKFMKTPRKKFLHSFLGMTVFYIILDVIYHLSDFDLSDMNILQKIFHLFFSLLGGYVFYLFATFSMLSMIAFLVRYIVLTIYERNKI
ncbi:MAG: hypothetical protein NC177_03625 [Ruminococcus flavefaciens]|nr:hypothetical protein [Ruminococcus flavefaciens]